MFQNYLKVALRNLRRTFGYTFINVSGLAVGLTCCLLSFLYVTHESSYDRFHEKADRIYRMANDVELSDKLTRSGATPMPHGPLLAGEIPAIERVVRLVPAPDGLVIGRGGERFDGSGYLFADSTFFDVFSFPLSQGRADAALAKPLSVVLSSEAARCSLPPSPLRRSEARS